MTFDSELELCRSLIERGDAHAGICHFLRVSNEHWFRSSESTWGQFLHAAREERLLSVFLEDPLTSRSFEKPRGYAGDADLLDLIYDHNGVNTQAVADATANGRAFNNFIWNAPEASAVRWRRSYVAQLIDSVAIDRPRILSIAAGNCRELSLAGSANGGRIGRFVALDQDEMSLETAASSYPDTVEPYHCDATALVRGAYDLGEFDLIYSAGLFDYLSDRAGRRLISAASRMAATDGRLCIANFAPTPMSIGYMESAMDWKLRYRSESDLLRLVSDAVIDRPYRVATRRDPSGTVVYVSVFFDEET